MVAKADDAAAGRRAELEDLAGGIASFLPPGTLFTLTVHAEDGRNAYLSNAAPGFVLGVMRAVVARLEGRGKRRPGRGGGRRGPC